MPTPLPDEIAQHPAYKPNIHTRTLAAKQLKNDNTTNVFIYNRENFEINDPKDHRKFFHVGLHNEVGNLEQYLEAYEASKEKLGILISLKISKSDKGGNEVSIKHYPIMVLSLTEGNSTKPTYCYFMVTRHKDQALREILRFKDLSTLVKNLINLHKPSKISQSQLTFSSKQGHKTNFFLSKRPYDALTINAGASPSESLLNKSEKRNPLFRIKCTIV